MDAETDIRITELKPSRVACYRAIGKQPEYDALKIIIKWAEEKGLMEKKGTHLFGFNNPGPHSGQEEYGYEVWLTVGPEVKQSGDVVIKDFNGGLFAVKRTNLSQIGRSWKDMVKWRESSKYAQGQRQCLEELLNPSNDLSPDSIMIDLYLPIEEI